MRQEESWFVVESHRERELGRDKPSVAWRHFLAFLLCRRDALSRFTHSLSSVPCTRRCMGVRFQHSMACSTSNRHHTVDFACMLCSLQHPHFFLNSIFL